MVLTSSFLCQLVQIQYSYQQSCSSLLQFDIGRVISISGCLTFLRLTMGKSRFEREISHLHPLPYTDMSHELWMDLKPDTAFTKHNEMISVKNEIWWGGVGWDRVQGTMKKVQYLETPKSCPWPFSENPRFGSHVYSLVFTSTTCESNEELTTHTYR